MPSTIGTQLAKQSGRSSAAASSAAGKEGAASVALARATSGIRADALKSGAGSAGSATVTALDRLATTSVTLRQLGGGGQPQQCGASPVLAGIPRRRCWRRRRVEDVDDDALSEELSPAANGC